MGHEVTKREGAVLVRGVPSLMGHVLPVVGENQELPVLAIEQVEMVRCDCRYR
jgi:hypothetical protein